MKKYLGTFDTHRRVGVGETLIDNLMMSAYAKAYAEEPQ